MNHALTAAPSRMLILAQGVDGGIAPLASELSHGLSEAGWDSRVIYIGRPVKTNRAAQDRARGVKSDIVYTGQPRSLSEVVGLLRSIRAIARIMRAQKPDYIIFAGFIPALLYPVFLRPFTKAKFVFWDHAPQNSFRAIKKLLFPLSLRHLQRIVSVSRSTANALSDLFGVQPERIKVINNGVNAAPWQNLPRAPAFSDLRILMPARMDMNQKDPLVLVRAAAQLHAEGINVRVTLVGSGKDEAVVTDCIRELGAASYITIIPHSNDVPSIMAQHNVLCLATKFEGLATVLIEGMLARRLVVASRVPGCIDIVEDGVNGLLFAPHSSEDCARALKSVLQRQDIPLIMERGYRQVCDQYTPTGMVDDFRRVLAA